MKHSIPFWNNVLLEDCFVVHNLISSAVFHPSALLVSDTSSANSVWSCTFSPEEMKTLGLRRQKMFYQNIVHTFPTEQMHMTALGKTLRKPWSLSAAFISIFCPLGGRAVDCRSRNCCTCREGEAQAHSRPLIRLPPPLHVEKSCCSLKSNCTSSITTIISSPRIMWLRLLVET